ncbi:MAG: squalene/phytoene synthase family protein [Novosphingobium sp.]|nr:squalene/phytoene synthase family protein [Novosphingobium sp.]
MAPSLSLAQVLPESLAPAEVWERAELVAHAHAVTLGRSRGLSSAARLLDSGTRERAWLLYAWWRACVDRVDGDRSGGWRGAHTALPARVTAIGQLTAQALAGEATGDPAFDGFGVLARECGIARALAHDVIAGFALDGGEWVPRGEADLLRYAYCSAGAVAMMAALAMGVAPGDEATLDRACEAGIAVRLATIARDLAEDDAAQRCYLPLEWLAEADIPPGEQFKPHARTALLPLVGRVCALERTYRRSARRGARRLPFRSRWAVLALAGVFGAMAGKVERGGAHAWDRHPVISGAAKWWYLLGALPSALVTPRRATEPPPRSRRGLAEGARETA